MQEENKNKGAESEAGKKGERRITDIAKKAFYSILSTEEGVRSAISSIIPKEIVSIFKEQFDAMKNEIMRIMSRELKEFLERANLNTEVKKILSDLVVEIKTEISFRPKEEPITKQSNISAEIKTEPEISVQTSLKKRKIAREKEIRNKKE